MALTQQSNLSEQAIANLVEQFRQSTKLQQLIAVYVRQLQDLEDSAFSILNETNISNAVGAQLDNIGSIIGEGRFGRSDADYRLAIKARIILNISSGQIESIIAILRALLGTVTVQITEYFPARFIASVITPIVIDPEGLVVIKNAVRSAKPAGVFCEVGFQTANPFTFDIGPGFDLGEYATTVA
jgi:hypothetical protein